MIAEIEAKTIEILSQYPIKRAAFFGSVARGDMTENSDVDVLVEFLPDAPVLDFFGLYVDLKEGLERSVDLITYFGLAQAKHGLKEIIENEINGVFARRAEKSQLGEVK